MRGDTIRRLAVVTGLLFAVGYGAAMPSPSSFDVGAALAVSGSAATSAVQVDRALEADAAELALEALRRTKATLQREDLVQRATFSVYLTAVDRVLDRYERSARSVGDTVELARMLDLARAGFGPLEGDGLGSSGSTVAPVQQDDENAWSPAATTTITMVAIEESEEEPLFALEHMSLRLPEDNAIEVDAEVGGVLRFRSSPGDFDFDPEDA